MRQVTIGTALGARAFLGLAAVAALAGPAWAYVNGGDFHSTLKSHETRLKSEGWGVSFGEPMSEDCDRTREVARGVKVFPGDNPEYQAYVNKLVAEAVRSLPLHGPDEVSAEDRREVARLARSAVRNAVVGRRQVIFKGQAGSLRYQVGAYEFRSWWETNYGGKRETHENRTGLAPFVAVRVMDATAARR